MNPLDSNKWGFVRTLGIHHTYQSADDVESDTITINFLEERLIVSVSMKHSTLTLDIFKLGAWRSVGWWQVCINPPPIDPPDPKPYCKIDPAVANNIIHQATEKVLRVFRE